MIRAKNPLAIGRLKVPKVEDNVEYALNDGIGSLCIFDDHAEVRRELLAAIIEWCLVDGRLAAERSLHEQWQKADGVVRGSSERQEMGKIRFEIRNDVHEDASEIARPGIEVPEVETEPVVVDQVIY